MELIKIIFLAFSLFVAIHEGTVLYCWKCMNELEKSIETQYGIVYSIIIIIWLFVLIGRVM